MGKGKKKQAKTIQKKKALKKNASTLKKNKKMSQQKSATLKIDQALRNIDELIDSFQYELAVERCEKILATDGSQLPILETLGSLSLELGDADKAFECFRKAVELSPDVGHLKYMYLGQLSQGEEAVQHFLKGIECMNKELQQDNEMGAVAMVGESTVVPQDISNAYCSIVEIFLTDCCFAEDAEQHCHEYCQKAIDSCPQNPDGYQLYGSYLLSKGATEEAKVTLLKGVALWIDAEEEEEHVPGYMSRVNWAKLFIEVEEFDKAFTILEMLLKLDDEVVQVWYLMGWLYFQINDFESATFYLQQCVQLFKKCESDDFELLQHSEDLLREIGEKKRSDEKEGSFEDDVEDSIQRDNDSIRSDEDEMDGLGMKDGNTIMDCS